MRLTNLCIDNRIVVLVFAFIITIAGIGAYVTLPRESAPDIKFPFILVMSYYEGTPPSDMETLVTYPIERKLKNLTDVKKIESTSSENNSFIMIEFEPTVDIETALQKVRDKVSEAIPDLPEDMEEPITKELSANDEFPVMFINISGDIGLVRLKQIAEDMEDEIEAVQGVLDAELLGGLEREIRVEFDLDRVSAYRLTMEEIVQTVTLNNKNTPGGSIEIGEGKYSLKSPSEFVSPEEINRLVVAVRDGKPVYLTDVAVGRDTFKDRDSFSRINGAEAVSIKVTKRTGEHLLRIADDVKKIIEKYRKQLPEGIQLTITSDSSEEIGTMVSDLENNILTALILVLAVVFISLGFRNAVLVSLAVPLTMLISFYVLQLLGFTLNMVVLFSLIMALGMLVDNAIVIVENIYRHHVEERKPLLQAARDGTQEVAWPVIGSTATTVVAFAPMVAWPGIMGQFMSYLPKTVIIVLLASLFVALFMSPVFALYMIKRPRKAQRQDFEAQPGFIIRTYKWFLRFGMRYRVLTLCFFFATLLIAGQTFVASELGVELFPDTEPKRIIVNIEAPQGTNVYRTNQFALQAEAVINRYGNIKNVTATVGRGAGTTSGPNYASIMIDMIAIELRKDEGDDDKIYFRNSNDTMDAIRAELGQTLTGVLVTVDKQEEGPPTGPPVNVEIAGDDYARLARLAQTLERRIENVPGLVDLRDDYRTGLPEVNVVVDKERAPIFGLNAYLIGQLVKAAVNGIKVGDFRDAEDEYDITARLKPEQRQTMEDVMRLRVPAPNGAQIPLTSVARVVNSSGLSAITHIDQKRVVTGMANVAKGVNSQQALDEVRRLAEEGAAAFTRADVLDPAGLVRFLNDTGNPLHDSVQKLLSTETRNQLAAVDATNPSPEFLDAVVADLNRALESGAVRVDQLQKAAPGLLAEPAGPLQLPPGYVIRYTGENEDKEESQTFMSRAFLTALLLVFLVLVIEFNSLLQTVIIMVSVILSFIGVFLGLIVTHQPFGIIMTGMAVISLAGVVVNNAIVLLDYINVLRQRGMSCGEAIIQAGATRFRPVMLTAVTCVLGLVPMALKLSYNFYEWRWDYNTETSQWWTSLANALIFGMMVATVLTLFVVPYVYSLIFDFRGKSLEPVVIPAENNLLFEGEPQTETEEGEMDKPEEGNL